MNTVGTGRNIRSYLMCMLPGFVILLLQNGAVVFCSQIYIIWMFLNANGRSAGFGEDFARGITSTGFLMAASVLYAIIGILVFSLWYRSLNKSEITASADNDETVMKKDTLKGYPVYLYFGMVIFAIAAQFVCGYVVVILAKMEPSWLTDYEELASSLVFSGGWEDILVALYTIVLGPVCEELCFRAVTCNLCRKVMSVRITNIIQALFFGGMHANPIQSIYAFVFGYFLGMIYLETDNLLITILIHILFNACGMYFGEYIGTGAMPASFFAIFFCAMMAAYWGYYLILKANRDKKS